MPSSPEFIYGDGTLSDTFVIDLKKRKPQFHFRSERMLDV